MFFQLRVRAAKNYVHYVLLVMTSSYKDVYCTDVFEITKM